MVEAKKLSVQLVDDHAVVRAGVRRLLENEPDIEVVVESDSVEDSLKQFRAYHPDVVVMDIELPGGNGLIATEQILAFNADARIIILSVHDGSGYAIRAMKAGVKGYLTKGCAPDELIGALRSVACGEVYLEPKIAQNMALRQFSGETDPLEVLTDREFDVFCMLAKGDSVKDIADVLCLSPKTVGACRTRIMKELGASNVANLAHIAIRSGLIQQ